MKRRRCEALTEPLARQATRGAPYRVRFLLLFSPPVRPPSAALFHPPLCRPSRSLPRLRSSSPVPFHPFAPFLSLPSFFLPLTLARSLVVSLFLLPLLLLSLPRRIQPTLRRHRPRLEGVRRKGRNNVHTLHGKAPAVRSYDPAP